MKISQENSQAMRNPWVLGMLTFLFVFLAANAIFIYLAFESPPNLVVKDFYEKGEAYEQTRERIAEEKSLGWSGVLMVPTKSRVNQTQTYEAMITGKNSAGLLLDSVTFFAYRPSDARADFSAEMQKSGHGSYVTDISFNLPGTWDIIVEAKQGESEFVITRRIRIDP
ncbi:FixH family protein [Methylophaga sp. OBS4]|uniref:FixH family protein n=1 Tax=Methylophaga sp. OBS4 TaxID=2991935 RepID=UPI00225ABEC2|nr:FixH family protein [Methylophaga sp. OBS4]MCX4188288.1 FixH family protein [Methylophaga sp. OBS4]